MRKYKDLSQNEKDEIVKYYLLNKKKTILEICKYFNISKRQINHIFNEYHINSKLKNRYTVNEDYLEKIDSGNKAYIIGLMLADGFVATVPHNSIVLESKDFDILENIRKEIGLSKPIRLGSKGNYEGSKEIYNLSLSNKKLANAFRKYGVYPHRKLQMSSIPNIPKKYIWDFIRGYFDGDGTICKTESKNTIKGKTYYYKRLLISIIGSEDFLKDLIKNMKLKNFHFQKSHTNGLIYLEIKSNNEIKRIYNNFYVNTDSNLYIKRKKDIFDGRINDL